jgi:hypothetical protein
LRTSVSIVSLEKATQGDNVGASANQPDASAHTLSEIDMPDNLSEPQVTTSQETKSGGEATNDADRTLVRRIASMGGKTPPAVVRGPLRIEIGTSSPELVAGRAFSLLVKISNPFDIPVEIIRVATVVPVEFEDLERVSQERARRVALKEAEELTNKLLTSAAPSIDKKKDQIKNAIEGVFEVLARFTFPFGDIGKIAQGASKVITASTSLLSGSGELKIRAAPDIDVMKKKIEELRGMKDDEASSKIYEFSL